MTLQIYTSTENMGELGNPLLAAGTAAAAIAGLILLVQNATADDWADKTVFQANMRKIHSAMLALQCIVGGAQPGEALVDSLGSVICPGGTRPVCTLPAGTLAQWRSLRDNFSKFWGETTKFATLYISSAEGQQAKRFAIDFAAFYNSLGSLCAQQGTTLPSIPPPPETPSTTPWLTYAAWGLGALAVIAVANSAKSIFAGSQPLNLSQRASAYGSSLRTRASAYASAAKKRAGFGGLGEQDYMLQFYLDQLRRDFDDGHISSGEFLRKSNQAKANSMSYELYAKRVSSPSKYPDDDLEGLTRGQGAFVARAPAQFLTGKASSRYVRDLKDQRDQGLISATEYRSELEFIRAQQAAWDESRKYR